jgi:hypothetical protein
MIGDANGCWTTEASNVAAARSRPSSVVKLIARAQIDKDGGPKCLSENILNLLNRL